MKLCSDGLYQLLVEKYRWTGIKSRPISGSTKCCTFLGSYKSSFNLNTHKGRVQKPESRNLSARGYPPPLLTDGKT